MARYPSFCPAFFFRSPHCRGFYLDGGPSEAPADLISGDLGAKKNVTEWVKNGETTAEAKALAHELQSKIEEVKKSTSLKLLEDYKFVFDTYILTPDSYDSKSVTVDQAYKGKGVLAVLEQNCPVLKASFKTYPDLRYFAYGNATKQVPDVDVLPIGSTVTMENGQVTLVRPGKPTATFMLFPWDARAAVEAQYKKIAAPAAAPVAPVAAPAAEPAAEPAAGPTAEPAKTTKAPVMNSTPGPDAFKDEDDIVIAPGEVSKKAPAPLETKLVDFDKLPTKDLITELGGLTKDVLKQGDELAVAQEEYETELSRKGGLNKKDRGELDALRTELIEAHKTYGDTLGAYEKMLKVAEGRTDLDEADKAKIAEIKAQLEKGQTQYHDILVRAEVYNLDERREMLKADWEIQETLFKALLQGHPELTYESHSWMGEKNPSKVVTITNTATKESYAIKIGVLTSQKGMPFSYDAEHVLEQVTILKKLPGEEKEYALTDRLDDAKKTPTNLSEVFSAVVDALTDVKAAPPKLERTPVETAREKFATVQESYSKLKGKDLDLRAVSDQLALYNMDWINQLEGAEKAEALHQYAYCLSQARYLDILQKTSTLNDSRATMYPVSTLAEALLSYKGDLSDLKSSLLTAQDLIVQAQALPGRPDDRSAATERLKAEVQGMLRMLQEIETTQGLIYSNGAKVNYSPEALTLMKNKDLRLVNNNLFSLPASGHTARFGTFEDVVSIDLSVSNDQLVINETDRDDKIFIYKGSNAQELLAAFSAPLSPVVAPEAPASPTAPAKVEVAAPFDAAAYKAKVAAMDGKAVTAEMTLVLKETASDEKTAKILALNARRLELSRSK